MSNKTVFITGGTGVIGSELVQRLAEDKFNVLFTSRNKNKIKEVEESYIDSYASVHGIAVDLESEDYLSVIQSKIAEIGLYPNALINNARNIDYLRIGKEGEAGERQWIGEFNFSTIIPYALTLLFANQERYPLTKVINIASMYGVVAPNLHLYENPTLQSPINYGVCKAAMIHLSKELAVRLASQNIAVNTISYGGVEGRVDEEFLARYAKLSPQGRMLKKADLFAPVRFLLADDCTGMTGHNLNYDGGWTIW
jgi:NAD(P)-dependent dehydrogenase (short-subunit alcohol dehydrogenase family)